MPFVPDADALARPYLDLAAAAAAAGDMPWRVPLVGDAGARAVILGWPAGFRTVPHRHPTASELFLVRSGRMGFRLARHAERIVGPEGFIVARPDELHGIRVVGPEPLLLVAMVGPNRDSPDEQVEEPDAWPDWAEAPRR
jgi:mannose-6-phosphate isomerase-like protein (cupin superfamily)